MTSFLLTDYAITCAPHSCEHGLRVVVGPCYEYGTGSKRKGPQRHPRRPPCRVYGPVNASPAQRVAAGQGRPCTQDELDAELNRVAPGPAFASEVSVRAVVPQVEVPGPDPPPTPEGSLSTIHAPDQWGSPLPLLPSFSFLESASQDDLRVPPMRWGTQPFPAVWQLPTAWQDCWRLWAALHFSHKWSRSVWRHCRRSTGGARYTAAGRRICGLPGEFCCRPASARQSVCCPFAMWLPPWEMLEVCGVPGPPGPSAFVPAYPLATRRGQATVFCNPSHRAVVFLCRPSQPPSWFCSSQASGAASVSRFRSRVSTTECPWRLFHLKPTVAAPRR